MLSGRMARTASTYSSLSPGYASAQKTRRGRTCLGGVADGADASVTEMESEQVGVLVRASRVGLRRLAVRARWGPGRVGRPPLAGPPPPATEGPA
jgi:hypothetical protein